MKKLKLTTMIFLLLTMFSYGCTSTDSSDEATLDDLAGEEVATSEDSEFAETADEDIEEFGEAEEESQAATENDEATFDEAEAQEEQAATEEESVDEETEVDEEAADETAVAEEPVVESEDVAAADDGETPTSGSNTLSEINFLASANGGTVEIKSDNPATYKVRQNQESNQIIVEIEDAFLPEKLKRPYIMKDFETVFGAINAYQNPGGSKARIVVQLKGPGYPVVTQEGNSILVTASGSAAAADMALKAEEESKKTSDSDSYNVEQAAQSEKVLGARTLDDFLTGSGQFFGRPISIQTNDANVRDIINLIAEESGLNIVLADDVDGKVSLKLRQVPWDQALVIVMRAKGLGYVRQGNVIRVTKLVTLQAESKAAKDIVDSQQKLTPLKVKVIPVSYAAVKDLETQVKSFLTERGKVVSDERTSSLIVTDTADILSRIERLIKELDIPPAQVMIEGKIVEATESFTQQIGVNWSMSGYPLEVSPSGGANGLPINASGNFNSTTLDQNALAGANGLFNFNIGTLDVVGNLSAILSLAQTDNVARIISSPRIVTMNKEKSLISQKGEVISITTQAAAGGGDEQLITASPSRTGVELKLEVTPQITADGSVILDVAVLRQFAGPESDPRTKTRPINSREAKTKVLVANGQTAVIGGIYQSDENESETGVPGLKNIPVLGWLFKQKTKDRQKNELLIFLTPRILNAKDQMVN